MDMQSKRNRNINSKDLSKSFRYWVIAVFAIKLIIIINIPSGILKLGDQNFLLGGIWLGADGESYLRGYQSLKTEGLFSPNEILTYWPAGYPLVIFFLSLLAQGWVLPFLSIFQSAIFSLAVYMFAVQISRTRLKKFSYTVCLLILLNPTLSLSSIVVGYESLTASGFLMVVAIIVKDLIDKNNGSFFQNLLKVSTIVGVLTFMQPRLLVSGLSIIIFWVVKSKGIRISGIFIVASLIITLLLPSFLIYRNSKAVGIYSISTNLGSTMNIGAGDNATGGYMVKGFGVPCAMKGSEAEQDAQKVRCVIRWYLNNPGTSFTLFYKKTIYFWAPWVNNGFAGEVYTGTMNRNPWLKINPVIQIATSEDGAKLVGGTIGKAVSWIWLFGGLGLLIYGFLVLWSHNSLERVIAKFALLVILVNWGISLMTIGDNRFRLPIMGFSLFLQGVAMKTVVSGGRQKLVESPPLR
jgi:hypothetical protein